MAGYESLHGKRRDRTPAMSVRVFQQFVAGGRTGHRRGTQSVHCTVFLLQGFLLSIHRFGIGLQRLDFCVVRILQHLLRLRVLQFDLGIVATE